VKKGQVIKHACLARHIENPALRPGSCRGRRAKLARAAATDGTESVRGSESEDEEVGVGYGEHCHWDGSDMDEDEVRTG